MEVRFKTITIYRTQNGKEPFREWLKSLNDKVTVARIRARIDRIEVGNMGDTKPVGSGVSELRLPFGSGYRIYFGQVKDQIVVLLIGGDKCSQKNDIKMAQNYWEDYLSRTKL